MRFSKKRVAGIGSLVLAGAFLLRRWRAEPADTEDSGGSAVPAE